jgi:hypothetical protein
VDIEATLADIRRTQEQHNLSSSVSCISITNTSDLSDLSDDEDDIALTEFFRASSHSDSPSLITFSQPENAEEFPIVLKGSLLGLIKQLANETVQGNHTRVLS